MENNVKPFFSIAIPVWGIQGKGIDYLETNLSWLAHQRFEDFEVVISDHSEDDFIKDYVELWTSVLDITYVKYDEGRGIISPNLNNAIRHCKGQYIKILFQDDFLFDVYSLEKIAEYIKQKDINWLVTGCTHTRDMETTYDSMVPKYHHYIHQGINTISCPTVLTIKNTDDKLYFDENLKWLMDVEYYKRLYTKYGMPDVLNDICVVNRDAEVRATTMITEQEKQEETKRVIEQYQKVNLDNVTIVSVAGIKAKEALYALKYSMHGINFKRAILITPEDITDDTVEIIKCEPLNYEQYNHFIVYRLHEYIDTEYALVVQNDGYVVNPTVWTNAFLEYDYIGALWPIPGDSISYKDPFGNVHRMGNGGFSLRSKKLLELPSKIGMEWKEYYGNYHEDGFICVHNRHVFESNGCKFAPNDIAALFSQETNVPENEGIIPLGFHGRNHEYFKLTQP